jgi:hypothetical protein
LELELNYTVVEPPRVFEVGRGEPIKLKDCAHIRLEADEQVTFETATGAEYDVTRKVWGFYATPSLNGRLERFALRAVLIKNRMGQFFVLLVERGHEPEFERYLDREELTVVTWLDSTEALSRLEQKLAGS